MGPSSFSMSVWTVAVLLAAVGVATVRLINKAQPDPYMDEIFHVPQAQNYCVGDYSHWDPMITTLPGLYLSSVLWVEPVARILSLPTTDLCTTANLRLQNSMFLILNFLLFCWLLRKLHKSISTTPCLLTAVSLTHLPVLYFSGLLYYTDAGSLFAVLLAYSLSLSHSHLLAGLVSLIAVVFRQTNILWVVFIAGSAFLQNLKNSAPSLSISFSPGESIKLFLALLSLLLSLWPYMVVGLTFALFLVWNGSVVVGDKTHHQMHVHLPQIFYFVSFSIFFSLPYLLGSVRLWREFLRGMRKKKMIVGVVCLLLFSLVSVHYFTQVHPYLLADNRHYPFYVWRKVFQRHESIKYLLTPFYSIATAFLLHSLAKTQAPLWILLFSSVCLLVLVPQQLLEFRYFIIPHAMLRLHLPPPSPSRSLPLLFEALLNVAVNYAAIWVFLNVPVRWEHDNSTHHFMW
ncbi:Dol-P-Glc:Glc(2)Man(9)GlcNAc(2)-PP-Dol alpha-1,2-glucosyltransferase [Geodia barretti]|uniref:Dol-P-Glc:Glc(2)Man(9)GlcNAc(2)-PP-Dol alpha-1,2-glucosyltransferase n=1 Tax=Geodia barretti TaxID=519541 RepID=A0AA35SFE7_GEOBA|nr:Dol-P-Glc:Glc(2)Man(9)GlcNAc(2)-PP-Dol alpha-1,2-glucosyltransferase [Geodia barretti]